MSFVFCSVFNSLLVMNKLEKHQTNKQVEMNTRDLQVMFIITMFVQKLFIISKATNLKSFVFKFSIFFPNYYDYNILKY